MSTSHIRIVEIEGYSLIISKGETTTMYTLVNKASNENDCTEDKDVLRDILLEKVLGAATKATYRGRIVQ